MLEGIGTNAFLEWLEFFRIKNELFDEEQNKPKQRDPKEMQRALIHNFKDYQAAQQGKVLRK